jgi:pimeloyl-ACP methyl ester carboxylesterase
MPKHAAENRPIPVRACLQALRSCTLRLSYLAARCLRLRKNGEPKLPITQKRQKRYHIDRVQVHVKSCPCLERIHQRNSSLETTRPLPDVVTPPPGVEECFVSINGIRTRYLRAGSGPALLLLHGLMGYSFSWRFVMPALALHRTVYAVDMPGAGFSDRPPDLDCCMRASAIRLLCFVKAMGISSFDLLGTSHGGAVAMIAASLLQDSEEPRLQRLILVDPVNPWSRHGKLLAPLLASRFGSLVFLAAIAHRPSTYKYLLRRLFGEPSRIPPDSLAGYAAPVAVPGAWRYGLNVASTWTGDLRQLTSILPRIKDVPVLLVWGTLDRAVSPDSAEMLRRQFANAELVFFPGVGHLPYEEAPEDFNQLLIRFLTQSPRATNRKL